RGVAQIDGVVEGEVLSEGELIIGEGAQINAKIRGQLVKVFGTVRGDIDCTERLELHNGAILAGNISSPSVVINDGVVFEGNCLMREKRKQQMEQRGDESGLLNRISGSITVTNADAKAAELFRSQSAPQPPPGIMNPTKPE